MAAQSPDELSSIIGRALVEGQTMTEASLRSGHACRAPAFDRAPAWTKSRFEAHGLAVRLEPVSNSAARGPQPKEQT